MPRGPEVGSGEKTRSVPPIDRALISRIHRGLSRKSVALPADPRRRDARPVRDLFREIREKRNKVVPVLGYLIQQRAELLADAARVERVWQASRAHLFDTNQGLVGTSNEKQREGRVASILREDLDARASLEADLALVDGALAHAKLVLDDFGRAHDECSRLLASLEIEWKIEGRL